VRILVRDHREEKYRRDEKELLDRFVQFARAEVVRLAWKLAPRHYFGSLTWALSRGKFNGYTPAKKTLEIS